MEHQEITRLFNALINRYKKKSDAKVSVFTTKNRNYERYIREYKKYFENNSSLIRNDVLQAFDESRDEIQFFSNTILYDVLDHRENEF